MISLIALGVAGLVTGCAVGLVPAPSKREVLDRVLGASVQVVIERGGDRIRTASGVAIARADGGPSTGCFVLTSAHTFSGLGTGSGSGPGDPSQAYVLLDRYHGAGTRGLAEIVGLRDADDVDLALLDAKAPACAAAAVGRPPALGDRIWIVGFPWGRQLRLIGGIVSQINLDDQGRRQAGSALMVDASVVYGMSGGGVFDAETGRLIGLVQGYGTARLPLGEKPVLQYIDVPVPGETYVTSVETVSRFLQDVGHSELALPMP